MYSWGFQWGTNIGSSNGLVPWGTKPLLAPMLTVIGHTELTPQSHLPVSRPSFWSAKHTQIPGAFSIRSNLARLLTPTTSQTQSRITPWSLLEHHWLNGAWTIYCYLGNTCWDQRYGGHNTFNTVRLEQNGLSQERDHTVLLDSKE